MLNYVIRRCLTGLVTLFGITVLTFSVIQLAPGDPAQMKTVFIENPEASERIYEELRAYYGLDKPLYEQYGRWIARLATGDLGNSFHDGQKVSRKVWEALGPTLSVTVISLFLALTFSLSMLLQYLERRTLAN